MGNLARVLGGLATAAGRGFEGYGMDRQIKVRDALAQRKLQGDEERDRVLNALGVAQTNRIINPLPEPVEYTPAKFSVGGKAMQGFTTKEGKYFDANRQPIADAVEPYEEPPAPDRTLVPVQKPGGEVVYTARDAAEGQLAPTPNSTGGAAIQKAIASNRTQLATLDDALKELDAHPTAVGLHRGAGELVSSIPVVGAAAAAVQDAANQRLDPQGVNARASLANVGSLLIHDRSGAAVTVSEYPRLKPFIPTSSDTPEAIRDKIAKLKQAIETETGFLSAGRGGSPAVAPRSAAQSNDPEFDALMAKYRKP